MKSLCKERVSYQRWTEGKKLAKLLVNKNIIDLILDFLKSTKVGERESAREKKEEWGRRNDWAGEELLEE